MEKLINKLQSKMGPLAEKISRISFLNALGQTFQLLLPVIMAGSFACLLAFMSIPAWQTFVTTTGLQPIFMGIQTVTLNIIALYVIIVFSFKYAESLEINPVSAATISTAAFLIVTPVEIYQSIPTQWLGYSGLFAALIIGGIVPKFIKFCFKKKIYVRMPEGVPPIVEDSFASLIPGFIVIILAAAVSSLIALTSFQNFHNVIYTLIQLPLQNFGLSLPAYLVVQLMTTLLMFLGIHGGTIFSITEPFTMAASAQNLAAFSAGQTLPNIITNSFSLLCQPGGIGATLGFAFLLAFGAKSKRLRILGKMAIVPAIFEISEPLVFGVPILLNPLLFIPYVLGPIVCTVVSYLSIALGITPYLTGVIVRWPMPQIISGFLAQGWATSLLQVFNIAITTLIWFPFFKVYDRQICNEEACALEANTAE